MAKKLNLKDEINLLNISDKVDSYMNKINKEYDIKLTLIRQSDLSDFKKSKEAKKIDKEREKALIESRKDVSLEIKNHIRSINQLISDKKFSIQKLNSWKNLNDDEKFIDLQIKYNVYRTPDGKRIDHPIMEDRVLFDYASTFRDVFITEKNRIKQSNSHLRDSSIKVDYNDVYYLKAILDMAIDKAIDIYKGNIGKPGAVKITQKDVDDKIKFYNLVKKAFEEIYPIESSKVGLLKNYSKFLFLASSNPIKEGEFQKEYQQGEKYLDKVKTKYPKNVIEFIDKVIEDTLRIIDGQNELNKKNKEFKFNILITDNLNRTTFLTSVDSKKKITKEKQFLEEVTGKKIKRNNTEKIGGDREER